MGNFSPRFAAYALVVVVLSFFAWDYYQIRQHAICAHNTVSARGHK